MLSLLPYCIALLFAILLCSGSARTNRLLGTLFAQWTMPGPIGVFLVFQGIRIERRVSSSRTWPSAPGPELDSPGSVSPAPSDAPRDATRKQGAATGIDPLRDLVSNDLLWLQDRRWPQLNQIVAL